MSDNPFSSFFGPPKPPNPFYVPKIPYMPPAATAFATPAAVTPAPAPRPPLDRLEAAIAWIRRLQKSRAELDKGTMAEWANRTRAIFKDIFGESSLMVKQIELWRLALLRGNTAKFESMLNDVEERLETLLDMTEGEGLTEAEQFLPRTFVSFNSSDIGKFRMMQAWTKSEHIPFNFYNCQLNEAINSHNPDYIKRRCRRRIRLASKFILLIGNDTYTKEQFVKPEVEAAIEKNCAMIGVNLDQSWRVNAKLTPSFMRNIGAIFLPFSPRIIQYALATYEANPNNDYTFTEAMYQCEGYRILGDKAVFRKC
jgi:hypothetical protein